MAKDARAVLLQALEHLDALKEQHGDPVRIYLAVAFSYETEESTFDGCVKTSDPTWVSLALLNRAYEATEAAMTQAEDDAGD